MFVLLWKKGNDFNYSNKTTRLANDLNTSKYFQIYDQCNFNNDKFGNIKKYLS